MCELPNYWTSNKRKARKQHECCECRSPILPGELYHDEVGVWDREMKNYKTCLECRQVSEKYQEGFTGWDCVALGYLYEDICDSDLLEVAKDDDGEEIYTPDGNSYVWESCVDWLEVVSHHPLKLKVKT